MDAVPGRLFCYCLRAQRPPLLCPEYWWLANQRQCALFSRRYYIKLCVACLSPAQSGEA